MIDSQTGRDKAQMCSSPFSPSSTRRTRGLPRIAVLGAAIAMLVAAANAGAQATSGSIVGHVTDSSGARIVGADVTATNVDTHIAFHGVTDKTGTYDLVHVTPGNYQITAKHAGFASETT